MDFSELSEYSNRKNNRLKRLIRSAELEQPDAGIAAIDYQSGRKLNKTLISRLATCEYITEYRNIFITGATGSGKTYMACAFGMEACKHYDSVKYVRLPDLLLDLQAARDNGTFALSSVKVSGISRYVMVKAPLQTPSWIVYPTIHTKSILKALIPPKISQCGKYMVWIRHNLSNKNRWLSPHRTGGSAAP